jgi:ABC-type Zn uptake system ZnuABC Zn-binding protein ZnuA
MKRALFAAVFAAMAASSFAVVKIVTTTPDLASIAQSIGGKNVTVSSILVGARDPHHIEAKPSYMSRVSSADLFIAVGLELEIGYEAPILEGSRNAKVQIGAPGHLYASDWTYILDKPTGAVSRAQGDIHPYGNPHIWLDPYNGRTIAIKLEQKLSAIDSKNTSSYKQNLDAFLDRLDTAMFGGALVSKFGGAKLWDWQFNGQLGAKLAENNARSLLGGWTATMIPLANRPVVTYHTSFSYFAKRFALNVIDELEPKPGLDPTPGHLAQVIQTMKSTGAKVIIQESFYPTKHAEFVASRTGARVVTVPQNVGHDKAATDYISFLDTVVNRVSGAVR